MTRLRLADLTDEAAGGSRLGNCLMQLQSRSQPVRERVQPRQIAGMIDWENQWSQNQEQLTRRLHLIEDELNKLVAAEMPPLSVVAADC